MNKRALDCVNYYYDNHTLTDGGNLAITECTETKARLSVKTGGTNGRCPSRNYALQVKQQLYNQIDISSETNRFWKRQKRRIDKRFSKLNKSGRFVDWKFA